MHSCVPSFNDFVYRHMLAGLSATIIEAPSDISITFLEEHKHLQICKNFSVEAGRDGRLEIASASPLRPRPQMIPTVFQGKGIGAMTASVLAALLGSAIIYCYTDRSLKVAKTKLEEAEERAKDGDVVFSSDR